MTPVCRTILCILAVAICANVHAASVVGKVSAIVGASLSVWEEQVVHFGSIYPRNGAIRCVMRSGGAVQASNRCDVLQGTSAAGHFRVRGAPGQRISVRLSRPGVVGNIFNPRLGSNDKRRDQYVLNANGALDIEVVGRLRVSNASVPGFRTMPYNIEVIYSE